MLFSRCSGGALAGRDARPRRAAARMRPFPYQQHHHGAGPTSGLPRGDAAGGGTRRLGAAFLHGAQRLARVGGRSRCSGAWRNRQGACRAFCALPGVTLARQAFRQVFLRWRYLPADVANAARRHARPAAVLGRCCAAVPRAVRGGGRSTAAGRPMSNAGQGEGVGARIASGSSRGNGGYRGRGGGVIGQPGATWCEIDANKRRWAGVSGRN
jgi:hypothetical protein